MIKGYKIFSQPYEPVTEMTSVGCRNCRKTWLEEMVHTMPVRVNGAMYIYDKCSECIDSGNSMLDGLNLFPTAKHIETEVALVVKPKEPEQEKTSCTEELCVRGNFCLCLITDISRLILVLGIVGTMVWAVVKAAEYYSRFF